MFFRADGLEVVQYRERRNQIRVIYRDRSILGPVCALVHVEAWV